MSDIEAPFPPHRHDQGSTDHDMHSPRHKEPSRRLFALLGQDVPPSPASIQTPKRPKPAIQVHRPSSPVTNTTPAVEMSHTRRSRGDKPLTRVMLPDQTETYEEGDLSCDYCREGDPPWRRNEDDKLLCKLCGLYDFRISMERRQQQPHQTSSTTPSIKGKQRSTSILDLDESPQNSNTSNARPSSSTQPRKTPRKERGFVQFELESLDSEGTPVPDVGNDVFVDVEEEDEKEAVEEGDEVAATDVETENDCPAQGRTLRSRSDRYGGIASPATSSHTRHESPIPERSSRQRASSQIFEEGKAGSASPITASKRKVSSEAHSRRKKAAQGVDIPADAEAEQNPIIRLLHRGTNITREWWSSSGQENLKQLVRTTWRTASRLRSNNEWIRRAQTIGAVLVLIQIAVLAALCIPSVQRHLLYLHKIRLPFNADFDNPEKYGLAPFKTRNLKIETADGEMLGAWHVLPHSYYETVDMDLESTFDTAGDDLSSGHYGSSPPRVFPPLRPFSNGTFERAFRERCTILYFHGNAATRAMSHRVRSASDFSRHLDCNVLAIDYRGYADSTGSPSEAGLLEDALAAWRYVASNLEASEEDGRDDETTSLLARGHDRIVLVGHSLGTGVAAKLAGHLADLSIHPKSIVLIAPFVSIPELLSTYNLLGLPLLGHLRLLPRFQKLLLRFLSDTWMTIDSLVKTKASISLIHATDDYDIPSQHSERLFDRLATARSARSGLEEILIAKRDGWGIFRTTRPAGHVRPVAWFAASAGGHNAIGEGEGVADLIRAVL